MFKNIKLMRITLLIIGILLLATSTVFVARRALAGSCFTDVANGSFWYLVTCWMKDKGISTGYQDGSYKPDNNVTRGEMSLFIQRAFSNSSQVHYLNTGPADWVADSYYPGYVHYYYGYSHLLSASAGPANFILTPTIPSSLYNTKMYVKGVKVCFDSYSGGAANGYLDYIVLKHMTYDTVGFHEYRTATNDANLNSIGCTEIYFTTPGSFWGNDQVVVILGVYFVNTAYQVGIGSTTIILQPSTDLAILGVDDAEAALLGRGGILTSDDPSSGFLP